MKYLIALLLIVSSAIPAAAQFEADFEVGAIPPGFDQLPVRFIPLPLYYDPLPNLQRVDCWYAAADVDVDQNGDSYVAGIRVGLEVTHPDPTKIVKLEGWAITENLDFIPAQKRWTVVGAENEAANDNQPPPSIFTRNASNLGNYEAMELEVRAFEMSAPPFAGREKLIGSFIIRFDLINGFQVPNGNGGWDEPDLGGDGGDIID